MSDDNIQLKNLENFLTNQNANYAITIDNFSMETARDGAKHYGISLNETTPTLILKSKDKYYAAIICGNTRISFKKLKQALGIKDISMADPETILKLTGAKIGEVSLINQDITTLVDSNVVKNENCYGGCGIPKATLRINSADLVRITNAKVCDFTDAKQ
jgi:prolyl-tRNA editing enzyme YbaK/EbsC (Cys-tRNA(Pro) deacylase)